MGMKNEKLIVIMVNNVGDMLMSEEKINRFVVIHLILSPKFIYT